MLNFCRRWVTLFSSATADPARINQSRMVSETAVDWRYHGRTMNRIAHRVLRERKYNRTAFRRAPVSAAPVPEEFDYQGRIDEATEFRGRCPKRVHDRFLRRRQLEQEQTEETEKEYSIHYFSACVSVLSVCSC